MRRKDEPGSGYKTSPICHSDGKPVLEARVWSVPGTAAKMSFRVEGGERRPIPEGGTEAAGMEGRSWRTSRVRIPPAGGKSVWVDEAPDGIVRVFSNSGFGPDFMEAAGRVALPDRAAIAEVEAEGCGKAAAAAERMARGEDDPAVAMALEAIRMDGWRFGRNSLNAWAEARRQYAKTSFGCRAKRMIGAMGRLWAMGHRSERDALEPDGHAPRSWVEETGGGCTLNMAEGQDHTRVSMSPAAGRISWQASVLWPERTIALFTETREGLDLGWDAGACGGWTEDWNSVLYSFEGLDAELEALGEPSSHVSMGAAKALARWRGGP